MQNNQINQFPVVRAEVPFSPVASAIILMSFIVVSVILFVRIRKNSIQNNPPKHPEFYEFILLWLLLIFSKFFLDQVMQLSDIASIELMSTIVEIAAMLFLSGVLLLILIWSVRTGIGDSLPRGWKEVAGLGVIIILFSVVLRLDELDNFRNLLELGQKHNISIVFLYSIVFSVVLEQVTFLWILPAVVSGGLSKKQTMSAGKQEIICVVICSSVFAVSHLSIDIWYFLFYVQIYVLSKKASKTILATIPLHAVNNFISYFYEMGIFV